MHLLTIPRDAILAPLQSVAGIVEKRHTLPILSNVLIEKRGSQLTLLATDIEIQVRTLSTGDFGGEDAAITVAAKKLHDILRALPDTAEITVNIDDKRMTVKAGKSRFALQTLPAADYPTMNLPEGEGTRFSISQKVFKRRQVPQMKLTANYPLAKPTRILTDEAAPVAEGKPSYQVAQAAQLQVAPGTGATVVRSLTANTRLTVLESRNGWSLVASGGKPLGYVATKDLAPAQ